MKIVKRLNPDNILVRYETGLYENRVQTSLSFENNYADALHTALEAVRHGYQNVSIVQYRETIHSHSDLVKVLGGNRKPTTWIPLPAYLSHVVALWGSAA